MTWLQRIGAYLSGAVIIATVGGLTRLSLPLSGGGEALIRLSWRLDGLVVEECRSASEEELSELPVHMRNPAACVGRMADYELTMRLAGDAVIHDTIAPGGARRDRPIYVFADVPVEAGSHDVIVRVTAIVPDSYEGGGRTDHSWTGTLRLAEGEIGLITMDESGGGLRVRLPEPDD